MRYNIRSITANDIKLVLCIVVISLCFLLLRSIFFSSQEPYIIEIQHRDTILIVPLIGTDETFVIEGLTSVFIERYDNRVAFMHSDCRDQICVNSGWLETVGAMAACLPNEVIVRIR